MRYTRKAFKKRRCEARNSCLRGIARRHTEAPEGKTETLTKAGPALFSPAGPQDHMRIIHMAKKTVTHPRHAVEIADSLRLIRQLIQAADLRLDVAKNDLGVARVGLAELEQELATVGVAP